MSKRTYITSLTAVNNSNIVTVNDGTDLTNISPGDDLRVDGLPGEAVKAITATQIILERPWPLANKTNVKGINVPTADDFREATKLLRDATVLTASNMSAVNDWTTQMGTVEFTDPAEPTVTYTVKTIRQLEQDAIVIIGSAVEDANRAEAARDAAIAAQNQAEAHKNTAGVSAGNAATKASEAATSASTANTAATTATTKAAEAVVSASNALSEADRAEVEANKAMMAVTSLYAMTEAQFEANRVHNRKLFAASGYVALGKHVSDGYWTAVNQGMWVSGTESSMTLRLGADTTNAQGYSKKRIPSIHVAGVIFEDMLMAQSSDGERWSNIKFPQAPDGKTTYNKATGINTTHASASAAFAAQDADPTNVEVVINRVDGWLKEVFPEEVSLTNPYIYPNGLLQSTATNMDGMTTSASNRPASYYSFFNGDITSKGKGVNFFELTDAQKKKVLANRKNNLVLLSDGRLIQWRLRIRTFAGFGNGDWGSIDSSKNITQGANYLYFRDGISLVKPQGSRNSSLGSEFSYPLYGGIATADVVANSEIALYSAHGAGMTPDHAASVNGECYALFGGTIRRLNQGLYHPSYNPDGAAKGIADTFWHNSSATISSTKDCFDSAKLLAGSGSISSGKSGRSPDGRYFDAIYAEGDGGVCRDMRYSAYGKNSPDFADARKRVRNGTYRGFEKQVFTRIALQIGQSVSLANAVEVLKSAIPYVPVVGEFLSAYDASIEKYVRIKITSVASDGSGNVWSLGLERPINRLENTYLILEQLLTSSVGGSFLQTDVIAPPASILANPTLANGWRGRWRMAPSVVEGVIVTRKSLQPACHITYTSNNGASWNTTPSYPLDMTTNKTTGINPIDTVVCQYQAYAKQTKPANILPIYGDEPTTIYASEEPRREFGVLLGESTLGVVGINPPSLSTSGMCQIAISEICVDQLGKLYGGLNDYSIGVTRHPPLTLTASDSPAFKTIMYSVSRNHQASLQFASTELANNGSNWGDDQKVTFVDYEATKTDLNGKLVRVSTHELAEPFGWIKNKD